MPTDMELILSALQETPKRKEIKRKVLQEFSDFGIVDSTSDSQDALTKLSKRFKRREKAEKRKQLPVNEWNSKDFLTYAQDLLKPYHVHLENDGSFGADMMSRMYDKLANIFQQDMTNNILREYLQWWVLSFGSGIRTHSVYIQSLYDEKYIIMFSKRYNEVVTGPKTSPVVKTVEKDDETIFKTGGLPMLLMSKGIVVAHHYLRKQKEYTPFTKISKVLRTFSASVLKNTMDITVNAAPYAESYKVDFISIARPSLELHGLKKYLGLEYGKFFQGAK